MPPSWWTLPPARATAIRDRSERRLRDKILAVKTRGFWLRRQQMRWLVVLLALLPLVPTGIIVRDLIKTTGDEREAAVAMVQYAERTQLRSITRRLSNNPDGPATAEALEQELIRIFGQDSIVAVLRPGETLQSPEMRKREEDAMVMEISEGRLSDWTVMLYREIEAPWFLQQQTVNRWWQAGIVMAVISLIAAAIWWAINRGLRVDELRSDLLATLAHEMKTPLSSMRVLLETLSDGTLTDPAQQREYLDLLQRENGRLSRLTEDFLTFGRLERGEIRLKSEAVELEPLVAEIVEELGPASDLARATVRTEIEPGTAVKADRNGLFAVVTNLVENGLKYGGEPPDVVVGARVDGEKVRLTVADSGPGIPRELRNTVFRRYFRMDPALNEEGSGVGLGLAICRQFVRRMDGRIRAESARDDGSGLQVVVTLPAAPRSRKSEVGSGGSIELQPEGLSHVPGADR